MKIKDLDRTANVAWSPKSHSPILLAAGTAAQQLDASFATDAALEIYALNLTEPGPDLLLQCTAPSDQRFHRIVWGGDTIVGGCDGGIIQIYTASQMLAQKSTGPTCKRDKHSGPVHALDFNPFQQNLLATGASDSEIFIWDINNTTTPMTPGGQTQPLEDVVAVAWNRQVQHILASTFATKCVIWDLRKNEPIIKLADTSSRVRWKDLAWHPDVATQLCLASEEDHAPVVQLWDLRFATSPIRTLENHQRGVIAISWCADDSDLLISCSKDNRILCWNPNSDTNPNGEILAEIARTQQWSFDLQWCPRCPTLVAAPNFDGHVAVYSLMGGKVQQIQTTSKIADSFPGMDGFVQAPPQHQTTTPASADLSKPPKWLKKPVGACFGFGGRLITFDNEANQRTVRISQMVTDEELVQKSKDLENAMKYGDFIDYCKNKADSVDDQHKKYLWHFIRANFEGNPRAELLNLLGYRIEDVNERLEDVIGKRLSNNQVDGLSNANRFCDHSSNDSLDELNNADPFESIAQQKRIEQIKITTGNDNEGLITQALLLGNVEAAVELCLKSEKYPEALIIARAGSADLLARTERRYLDKCQGSVASLIGALVSDDWSMIISNCDLANWKEALAAALTHASDDVLPSLCEQLGRRLENDSNLKNDAQLCYICAGNFERLIHSWNDPTVVQSSQRLQEIVELTTFLKRVVERQGKRVAIDGALADVTAEYASRLAAQGELETALNYLEISNNLTLQELSSRISVAIGRKPYNITTSRPSFDGMARSTTTPTPVGYPRFNTGLPANAWQPTAVTQPTRSFSPAAPVTPNIPPPRPTSVGSNSGGVGGGGTIGGGGLPSRKYVVDPSVTSHQYGHVAPRNFMQPPSIYQPPQQDIFQPPQYQFQSTPLNPVQPMATMAPPVLPPPNPVTPVAPTLNPAPLAPVEKAQIAYESSAPGWNDPPVFNRPPRAQPKVVGPNEPPPPPITHPLYGAAPVPVQPAATNGYDPNRFVPPPNVLQPQVTPQFQPAPMGGATYAPGLPPPPIGNATYATGLPQQQQQLQPPLPPAVVEKPQPIQKPPIPEEHLHMQTVFDELKERCICAAANPQTKRKLEDVGRKLEILYDLLRERKLTQNTLTGLQQMVQLLQNGDYMGCLNLHTQLVSGPDFAQIASFMPGLKVLIQCALQLQVYLR